METIRYLVAVLLYLSLPTFLLYWFLIHFFIGLWRNLGVVRTYLLILIIIGTEITLLFRAKDNFFITDYSASAINMGAAVVLLMLSAFFLKTVSDTMSLKVLAGIPEISPKKIPQKLMIDWPFSLVRHPRYLQVAIGLFGASLFANFRTSYVVFIIWAITLKLIMTLEERELRVRFGNAYVEYSKKVPQLIPRCTDLIQLFRKNPKKIKG